MLIKKGKLTKDIKSVFGSATIGTPAFMIADQNYAVVIEQYHADIFVASKNGRWNCTKISRITNTNWDLLLSTVNLIIDSEWEERSQASIIGDISHEMNWY